MRNIKLVLLYLLFSIPMKNHAQTNQKSINETLIPFHNAEGKWGYLDAETGKVRISPKYDGARLFEDGIAQVSNINPNALHREESSFIGLIDTNGREIFPPQFTGKYEVKTIRDSVLPNLIQFTTEDGENGIARTDGTWLVPLGEYKNFTFYNSTQFIENDHIFFDAGVKYAIPKAYKITRIYPEARLFEVEKGEYYSGILSWEGKVIVQADYLEIEYLPKVKRFVASRLKSKINIKALSESKALLLMKKMVESKQKDPVVIDLLHENGKKIASFPAHYVADVDEDDNEMASYEYLDETHYFSLLSGKIMGPSSIEPKQEYEVFSNKKYDGLKDSSGKVVIPPKYLRLTYINPDLIIAQSAENYKYGIINIQGKQLTPFEYRWLEYRRFGMLQAEKDSKYGMIDANGNILIDLKYQYNFSFDEDGLAEVKENYKAGIIDTNGKVIVPSIYKTLFNSQRLDKTEKTYYTAEKDGRWGLLDSTGNTIIPFDYGHVSIRKEDFVYGWVSIEDTSRNRYGRYNIESGVIIPPEYDGIKVYPDFLIVSKREGNEYSYQLLTPEGKPLTDSNYTEMEYRYGYLTCRKDKLYGVLDITGKVLVPFIYRYLWQETPRLISVRNKDDYFYINTEGKEFKEP